MILNRYERMIARRYLLPGKGEGFIFLVAAISLAAVAPWTVGLVTMRGDDAASIAAADDIYARLTAAGVETLYDDRDERGGVKLGSMDLIGLPWQLILGPRGLAAGTVELKNRRTGEKTELTIADALARLTA